MNNPTWRLTTAPLRIIAYIFRALAWFLDPRTPPPWATTHRISRLHNRRHGDRR